MGGRTNFADGGLAHAAQAVSDAGRFGDDIVIHINQREFNELRQKWGDPHINPHTGLPEFWGLKDLWKSVKKYVAPVAGAAAGAFLPGLGNALGSVLPGVAGALGTTGTQALASGLLGAGLGALTNGGKGALLGGLGGIAGSYGGDLFRNGSGSALAAALAGGAGGGADVLEKAAASNIFGGGLGDMMGGGAGMLGGSGGFNSSAFGPALMMAALNLGGSALSGKDRKNKAAKGEFDDAEDQFNKPLPVWNNPREQIRYDFSDVPDYTQEGEREYFRNNHFADGGAVKDESRAPSEDEYWAYHDAPYNPDSKRADLGIDPINWIGYLLGAQREWPEVEGGKTDREDYADGGYVDDGGEYQADSYQPYVPPYLQEAPEGYADGGPVGYAGGGSTSDGRADDIDARLSPGEYVMDAETVALLGNGSTEAGAAQLDRLRSNIRKHKGSALAAGAISPDAMPPEHYL